MNQYLEKMNKNTLLAFDAGVEIGASGFNGAASTPREYASHKHFLEAKAKEQGIEVDLI